MSNYQKDMARYIIDKGVINGKTSYYGSYFREPDDGQVYGEREEIAQEHTDNWKEPKCGGWAKAYDLEEFYEECFNGTFASETYKAYAVRVWADCECGTITRIPIVINGTFEEILHGVLGVDEESENLLD